jgi:DNA-binding NarL/FixJ family response regulator
MKEVSQIRVLIVDTHPIFRVGIAESRVKCHVSVILMQLDANVRTHAVATTLQRGQIHLQPSNLHDG